LFLLLALFLLQATPSGVITGVIRTPAGVPQAGVRVYAVALRDAAEATAGLTVFEALTQTDAAGKYRLEVPAGRYLIAGGAVALPIYYPGTVNAAAARPVTVAAGAVLDNVDFSGVNPAGTGTQSFYSLQRAPAPAFTTTILGSVRLQDGSPAKGIEVVAVPMPRSPTIVASPRNIPSTAVQRVHADEQGGFRFANVAPGDYYIISGTRDVPSFYSGTGPSTPDSAKATPVTVTQPQSIQLKDFSVSGVTLGGRVTAASGFPAIGVTVSVRGATINAGSSGLADFLSAIPSWETVVNASDGTYSVSGLPPAAYAIRTSVFGVPPQTQNVLLGGASVHGVDFSLPTAVVAGKILNEDGSPFSSWRALGNLEIATSNNPNLILSTLVPVASGATFSSVIEPGEYRVALPSLPSAYTISSMTAGGKDLLKESLIVTKTESVNVEIRLKK
jgi:hypothetical protein